MPDVHKEVVQVTTTSTFGILPPARQAEVDALKDRLGRFPQVKESLRSDSLKAANLIAHAGFPAATPEAAAEARRSCWATHKWQRGDTVLVDQNGKWLRPYRGRGRTAEERLAWAHAVNANALAILDHPVGERFVLDRVEYAARGIGGMQQGKRLGDAYVAKLKSTDPELFGLKVQTLVKYASNVHRQDMSGVLSAFDAGLYELPEVFSIPVDDAGDGEELGKSRWVQVFVDGMPFGAPVATWMENGPSIDAEYDPQGRLRALDLVNPLDTDDIAKARKAQAKRVKRVANQSARARRGELSARERAEYERWSRNVVAGQRAWESEQIAARATAPKPRPLTPEQAEAERIAKAKADEALARMRAPKPPVYARELPAAQPGTTAKAAERVEVEHVPAPKFLGASDMIGRSTVHESSVKREMLLLADESEVLAHRLSDVPMTDVELLEEALAYFDQGVDPDTDLSLDLALEQVPALRGHLEARQRNSTKAPRGLIGALAQARLRQANLTRFDRGLGDLGAALGS